MLIDSSEKRKKWPKKINFKGAYCSYNIKASEKNGPKKRSTSKVLTEASETEKNGPKKINFKGAYVLII